MWPLRLSVTLGASTTKPSRGGDVGLQDVGRVGLAQDVWRWPLLLQPGAGDVDRRGSGTGALTTIEPTAWVLVRPLLVGLRRPTRYRSPAVLKTWAGVTPVPVVPSPKFQL